MERISLFIRHKTGHSLSAWLVSLFVLVFIIIQLVPLFFVASNSMKTKDAYLESVYALPDDPYWGNYEKLLTEYNFPQMFKNSIFLTLVSVLVTGYLGAMAAFAVSKFSFKGRGLINILILPLMSIPGVILLIPLFVLFSAFKMTNSLWVVVIIYIGLLLPFTMNILSSFMNSVPSSLLEASMLDGCGFLRMFNKIVFPLVIPGFSAASIVNAMWIWNELLIVFVFTQDEAKRTLILGLTSLQGLYNLDVPLLMAGAAITSAPMILLFVLSQKWFIRGLIAGGEK